MNRTILISAAAAILLLSGCASDRYGYGGGAVAYGGPDIYYDDYYGPFYDGYWGPDGAFFYSENSGRPFHRDEGGHFRHEAGAGFHHVAPHAGGGRMEEHDPQMGMPRRG